MAGDNSFLTLSRDENADIINLNLGTIDPGDTPASETVKGSRPRRVELAHGVIHGPKTGVNGNPPEDCIDFVFADENGTTCEEAIIRDSVLISGSSEQQQALTLKGGCKKMLQKNLTFYGTFKRGDIVAGDYVIYWPVQRMKNWTIESCRRADGNPVVVWCLWSDKPTIIDSNVKLRYKWVPSFIYFFVFTILRFVRGKEK